MCMYMYIYALIAPLRSTPRFCIYASNENLKVDLLPNGDFHCDGDLQILRADFISDRYRVNISRMRTRGKELEGWR